MHHLLRRFSWLIFLLALFCVVVAPVLYWGYLNTPSPFLLETTTHDAQIYIAADRTIVPQKWDCITLTWRLQNIGSVYLAGQGTVGEDTRELCPLHSPIAMTIYFQDGTHQDFLIPIEFLLPYGLPAQLIVLAVCLCIGALVLRYASLLMAFYLEKKIKNSTLQPNLIPQSPQHTIAEGDKNLAAEAIETDNMPVKPAQHSPENWRGTLAILLLLVLLQMGWRLAHFPNMPLTCCDHTLIPGRALELAQFPVFSVTEFRFSAIGQAFLSRYGIGIYLIPYFVYETLQTLGIPLTNFALHLPAFLYGIIKLPLIFALAYQLTERKGVALFAAALVGVYWEAVVINSTYYGTFPHIIGESFMLLFAVRWMKYRRFADMFLAVIGMVLVIALHSLFMISLGLLAVLALFPPPGVKRQMPWHFFWHARELLPIPILLLVMHALTDIATQMDLGYNNGEGIFLRFFSHTGDGWHPELLFSSGVQYYSWIGWLAFIVALASLMIYAVRTKHFPFELAWVAPYLCLYLINSGLYIVFITPVVGIITARGLAYLADNALFLGKMSGWQPVFFRAMASLLLLMGIFAHSASFVELPDWWMQCYKPMAVILDEHFPDRTLSSSLPIPAFYYQHYSQTLEFDTANLILIVDERFQYPQGSENEKSLRRNQAFLAQLTQTPLPTIATFVDDLGQPVCHLLGANGDSLGALSIADLSQAYDAAHTRMLDFVQQ